MAETFTPNYQLSMFAQGDNPGAHKLNANWENIDEIMAEAAAGIATLEDHSFLTFGAEAALPNSRRLLGTANQVVLTENAGDLVLSLPQSIAASSSPTFAGLNLSGLTPTHVLYAGAGGIVSGDAGLTYVAGTDTLTVGTQIKVGATSYLGLSNDGTSSYVIANGAGSSTYFGSVGTASWQINASNHLLAFAHNTYDYGSGAAAARTIYAGTSFFAPVGTAAAPSVAVGTAVDGFYLASGGVALGATLAGALAVQMGNGGVGLGQIALWNTAQTAVSVLRLDTTNGVAAFVNGATSQTLRIYGTTTGPRYLRLAHDGTNSIVDNVGGGALYFGLGGSIYWLVDSGTNFIPGTDGASDCGAAANRIRGGYFSVAVRVGTNPASGGGGIRLGYATDGSLSIATRNSTNAADYVLVEAWQANSVPNLVAVGRDSAGVVLTSRSGGAAPTTSDIAAGEWCLWRDTGGATTKLYYNNAGAIQSVALA